MTDKERETEQSSHFWQWYHLGFIGSATIKEMQSHYWNNTLDGFYQKTLKELNERGLNPKKLLNIQSNELDDFCQKTNNNDD
ncbi:MAG: hypothetical protein OXE77_11870 [Flavobacteriaceae bacterium]|nr:hypothetical protein [Flavobacteriaceae bacterium]